MYLDFAEDQAQRNQPVTMADWKTKLDAFLQFNDREILDNAGNISAALAKEQAEGEYERFNARRLAEEAAQDEMAALEREAKRIEGKR
tara:strand:+ start:2454 stop:2717 length:264 start_codon:yes stop_codon:yes gene_type:complete